ncbi:peptidylprolyl isomerase [Gemmatimonas sp.]|uniref:peptidylprolyl isomerase n=1 Tax=Gemmatimonas sp. TaxID=1962908 RepID=UPI0035667A19
MWLFVPLLLQAAGAQAPVPPTTYELLRAEHARGTDMRAIDAALVSGASVRQRLAVRAVGRFEQSALEPKVIPLLTARTASVRREAVNALGQMRSRYDLAALLTGEKDASVRAVIYETLGRIPTAPGANATAVVAANTAAAQHLTDGLRETDPLVRAGAARGIESLLRRAARVNAPSASTLQAIRDAVCSDSASDTRQLLLLALTAANDRDSTTVAVALRDTSAEVRRVGVALGRIWVNDNAPMVRWQALRVAGTCARAAAHVRDTSEHVALLAIDLLGDQKCTDAASLAALDGESGADASWRHQAHAALSLAKVAPGRASAVVQRLAISTTWQARVYAANAAKLLKDSATLNALALDKEPNVVIAAMTTREQALRALLSDHAGLVLAAAAQLKGDANLASALPQMRGAFDRFTAMDRVRLRDPRAALLERIGEAADGPSTVWLRERLKDPDPAIASSAAQYLSKITGATVLPITTRYEPAAFPSAEQLRGLDGATATMRIRGIGNVELALRFDDAPMAVHTFVTLASAGKFNGLTFHRIVSNFVIQGGSPGADEYDPITDTFMRDEVGLARNARGSFGISTRGRDTGDGQIYVNLVNNFRLDHDYTVFADVTRGLDLIDRVQEGDVIESIVVRRATTSAPRRP